jgi:transmembrane sensor
MSEIAPDADRLLDEAIDLMIRLQASPGNPVATEMIRAWRARGPEHEQIWARVSDAHGMSGKVLTDRRKAERRQRQAPSRRNVLVGGGIGLGALAAGALFGPDVILHARADYVTDTGEIRRIRLPDDSHATLGPDSAIAVAFDDSRRGVTLLKGMSFFEVATDTRRPFQVQCGPLTGTADSGAFDLSNDAGVIQLSVDQGGVETRIDETATRLSLASGDWMSFDPASQATERGHREPGQVATWRDKYILAEREPVSVLVARIGRWIPGRVLIADPFVGSQRISGLFDLSDPERALEAAVLPAGGRIRRASSLLTVVSPL